MKIHILSDLHREFEPYLPTEQALAEADVIVLAGDVDVGDRGVAWAMQAFRGKPVIYLLGNHEYYGQTYPTLIQKLVEATDGSEVHVLENRAHQVGQVTFHGATLWTDFALFGDADTAQYGCQKGVSDFRRIFLVPGDTNLTPRDAADIHRQSVAWLEQSLAASTTPYNVIVTHHAPSMRSVEPRFMTDIRTAAFASHLDPLVEDLASDLWIHGHMHNSSNYTIGQCRVLCNPLGYPSDRNPWFDPDLIVELQE